MFNLRRKLNIALIMIFLSTTILLSGCSSKNVEPISRTELWLDTPCTITLHDKPTEKNLDKAFAALKNVHDKMNVNSETSEVSNINKNSGGEFVKVSDETFYVIGEAKKYNQITQKKFDITVGPLVKLWGINTDTARVPSKEEVAENLKLVNSDYLTLNETDKSVKLEKKGMSIDLGGIAKGYAADAVKKELKAIGINHALINLGGNVITVGTKPDGSNWRVGVQNPVEPRGEYIGILQVADKAVVTSGIYERYLEQDGKIYHHIFDTATGYPVDNNLASVTIVTDKSINGDALAKSFCMGLEKGLTFIQTIEGVDAIFITKNSEVYITPGLKDTFQITDTNFTLMN
jgi:FAD:protein FMN transferase